MKTYYMIGNAHLDPVWMWRWTEGAAEARATFASALKRMEEYDDFVFTCAGASVYEWVEQTAPELFERVKARVAEGRWVIVGGQFVQPDCNLPSGESLARQFLYSQRYFKEKFGVIANIGYNVDSFGHCASLPAFLRAAGIDGYCFMRPGQHEKALPAGDFIWRAPDGSEVTAHRLTEPYCRNFDDCEQLRGLLPEYDKFRPDNDVRAMFYGVGDHGGGPTKKSIDAIHALAAEKKDKYVFSGPRAYFDALRASGSKLPVIADELQHHASGCYSTMSRFKAANRRCENSLVRAETLCSLASLQSDFHYEGGEFCRAWKDLLFAQFHDSMGGCSIKPVFDDAEAFLGEAEAVAAREQNRAIQTIAARIDTSAAPTLADGRDAETAIVFNPHPFEITAAVVLNRGAVRVVAADGSGELISQPTASPTRFCTGRPDTVFRAAIPAFGRRAFCLCDGEPREAELVKAAGMTLDNGIIRATVDADTGCVSSFYDISGGRELLGGRGEAAVYDESDHDTWSHCKNRFTGRIGAFTCVSAEITERGPVRSTLKTVSKYGTSRLIQYFTLYAGDRKLNCAAKLIWYEPHCLLKMGFTAAVDSEAVYEIPFARLTRPAPYSDEGDEEPTERWAAAVADGRGFVLYNDSKYSFSFAGRTLKMTAVRSPLFGDHGKPRDPEGEFCDFGEQTFAYALAPFESYEKTDREASEFNMPAAHIVECRHTGALPCDAGLISGLPENMTVEAFKAAEDGNGYILRLRETSGTKKAAATVKVAGCAPVKAELAPFAFATFRLGAERSVPTSMLEYDA